MGAFDRLRIEGPVSVAVVTGPARVQGRAADRAVLDRLVVVRDGSTLLVRLPGTAPAGLGTAPDAPAPVHLMLSTPALSAVAQQGTGTIEVARLFAERVDIVATGGGRVTVAAIQARQLAATLVGGGRLTLSGRAAEARLIVNGDGLLDASTLTGDDVRASLIGDGEVRGKARYAARVVARGKGRVSVVGNVRCEIRAAAEAVVACGR